MPKSKSRYNWPLVGNVHISDWLSRIMAEDKAAGTYILNGPEGLGKATLAKAWAQMLLCEDRSRTAILPCGHCSSCRRFISGAQGPVAHGDLHLLAREEGKKNISVSQARSLIDALSMSSFLNSHKIGIIKEAETMSEEAANALLKTLEEPRPRVVVMLVTSEAERLPATIRSRAQILNFRPVSAELIYEYLAGEQQLPRAEAKVLSRLALGRPALALKLLLDRDFRQRYEGVAETFIDFCDQDLNARFQAISRLLPAGKGQDRPAEAAWILDVWQGVVRDLLLFEFGHFNLSRHEQYRVRLERLKPLFGVRDALAFFRAAGQARQMIRDNVSPALALETVAVIF